MLRSYETWEVRAKLFCIIAKLRGRDQLGDICVDLMLILVANPMTVGMNLRAGTKWRLVLVAGCSGRRNKLCDFLNSKEFSDLLSHCWLLKKALIVAAREHETCSWNCCMSATMVCSWSVSSVASQDAWLVLMMKRLPTSKKNWSKLCVYELPALAVTVCNLKWLESLQLLSNLPMFLISNQFQP